MQVIYAAPFILLSLFAFFVCLLVPSFRPYSFRAIVAPVVFGFCSLFGMVIGVLALHSIQKNPLFNRPLTDLQTYVMEALLYFPPGLIGAWIAVTIVKRVEERWLNTHSARAFAVRLVIALIVFPPAFLACFGLSDRGENHWALEHLSLSLPLAFLIAALAAASAYGISGLLQQRPQSKPQN
jgi:hypothetical protein